MSEQPSPPASWADVDTVRTVAFAVIIVAGSWWLLGQLQAVMRPLLLAGFLSYVLLPQYNRLRKKLPASVAISLLASLTVIVMVALALSLYSSLVNLSDELPGFQQKIADGFRSLNQKGKEMFDSLGGKWLKSMIPEGAEGATETEVRPSRPGGASDGSSWNSYTSEPIAAIVRSAVNAMAGGLLEAAATGLYLLFLLMGAERFPKRVKDVYPPEQADYILTVLGRINAAIVSYLKAKVQASLLLAIPVGLVLWIFGVKFALLWTVLTFLCNFIPYVGSAVACFLPIVFAFLQLGFGVPPAILGVLILALHISSASFVEPLIIGKAVGLSPLLILATLSIWGLIWGLPGMFLAVPLTVVMKIVFENIQATRSMSKLLMED